MNRRLQGGGIERRAFCSSLAGGGTSGIEVKASSDATSRFATEEVPNSRIVLDAPYIPAVATH